MTETAAAIVEAHRIGAMRPEDTVARSYARIRAYADPATFITLRDEAEALAEARRLTRKRAADLRLYGVPVAVKDNIDVAGMPTTAACPAYAYTPTKDATAVARLRAAGAVILGKTNLDQFATGLVGVRSPYGVPRNPFNPALIPGGSSSGSAVAVAAGLVPLALGTDTAGSGRIPAGLNNIVGLKPSLGLISNAGVVPACRSLDCVSIFALDTDDAYAALGVMASTLPLSDVPPGLRIGVPRAVDRLFEDKRAKAAFAAALKLAGQLGRVVEIDLTPFLETARLLYEGPWLAERWAAVGDFIAQHPKAIHPVTRKIISGGKKASATDAFRAFYRLAELRAQASAALSAIDVLMVPTAPAAYTVAEVKADPIALNSKLGTYTNFVNLLDLAGLAVPAAFASDGTPFGVTFLAPAGQDALLASLGRFFHARTGLPLGALKLAPPPLAPLKVAPAQNEVALAVVGAHLSGMPLNGELKLIGARFLGRGATASSYKLYALAGTQPPKPGLLRVASGQGSAIEVEIWALPVANFGRFVVQVPPPLSIGTVALADGRAVRGFLVEAEAVKDARDISSFGGWRAFVEAMPA